MIRRGCESLAVRRNGDAEFRTNLLKDLAPANTLEEALAERVVENYWRLQRFYRVENAFMANCMDAIGEAQPEMRDGDAALATLFTDPAEMARTRLMLRYLTTAERAYNKAYADLTKAQSARRKQEAAAEGKRKREAMKETLVAMQREKVPAPPANGFASQNTPHNRDTRRWQLAALPPALNAQVGPRPAP